MTAYLLALLVALILNVASGSLVFLLWNAGPASVLPVSEMGWGAGVACFLLIRLVVSPPKLALDLKWSPNSQSLDSGKWFGN